MRVVYLAFTLMSRNVNFLYRSGDLEATGRRSAGPSTCRPHDHSLIRLWPTTARPTHCTGSGQSVGASTR
jgi:hypothetical protein